MYTLCPPPAGRVAGWCDHTVPLLQPDEDNVNLLPVEDGFEMLWSIKGPVAIVAFIGRARSGKSYSLNHLLGIPSSAGFPVGHSFSPKTKGAQLWGTPIYVPETGVTVLFLDTEGLGTAPALYDKAMTLFAAMVSSQLVYHLSEYAYQDDVSRLYSIVGLAEMLKKDELVESVELPPLTWLIQRSALKNEYASTHQLLMENILAEKPNPLDRKEIFYFNETARAVKSAFHVHSLILAPPALPDYNDWPSVPSTDIQALNPEFRQKMAELRSVLLSAKPKQIGSSGPLTGEKLATFAKELLPSINKGEAFLGNLLIEKLASDSVEQCSQKYSTKMSETGLPLDEADLYQQHMLVVSEVMQFFDQVMVGGVNSYTRSLYQSRLRGEMDTLYNGIRQTNSFKSLECCTQHVETTVTRLNDYISINKPSIIAVEVESQELLKEFEELVRGPSKSDCRSKLMSRLSSIKQQVMLQNAPSAILGVTRNALLCAVFLGIVTWLCWSLGSLGTFFGRSSLVATIICFGVAFICVLSLTRHAVVSTETALHHYNTISTTLKGCISTPIRVVISIIVGSLILYAPPYLLPELTGTSARYLQSEITTHSCTVTTALARKPLQSNTRFRHAPAIDPLIAVVRNTSDSEAVIDCSISTFHRHSNSRPIVVIGLRRRLGLSYCRITGIVVCVVWRVGQTNKADQIAAAITHQFALPPRVIVHRPRPLLTDATVVVHEFDTALSYDEGFYNPERVAAKMSEDPAIQFEN
ncbi:guanylate-binding family protein [Pelomyxa schiedti]|nr:guanylate-binding family protein [Pelomyxa schiedti]